MKKQSVGRLRRSPSGLSKEAGNCTRKRQGELSEIAFALKATELGFKVYEPVGDSQRYDFIIDTGQHLWRIQVKSTAGGLGHDADNGCCILNASWASQGPFPYTADQIDFLAAHIISLGIRYIIRAEAFTPRTSLPLYPSPDSKSVGRYEKDREAWSLLANAKLLPAKTRR